MDIFNKLWFSIKKNRNNKDTETSQPVDEIGRKEIRKYSRLEKKYLDLASASVLAPNIDDPIFLERYQMFMESQHPTFPYSYSFLMERKVEMKAINERSKKRWKKQLERELDRRMEQELDRRRLESKLNPFVPRPRNASHTLFDGYFKRADILFINQQLNSITPEQQLSRIKNWHEAIKARMPLPSLPVVYCRVDKKPSLKKVPKSNSS